jgi:hypothetical protein
MNDENLQRILEERVNDHEERLRKIEANNMEMKYELLNINKSQSDLKLLFVEQNKEHSKQLDKVLEQISSNIKTDNEIKLIDRKELWALVALIIGSATPFIWKVIFGV